MCLHIESDLNGIMLYFMNVNFIFSGESGIQVGYILRQKILLKTAQVIKGDTYFVHPRTPWRK